MMLAPFSPAQDNAKILEDMLMPDITSGPYVHSSLYVKNLAKEYKQESLQKLKEYLAQTGGDSEQRIHLSKLDELVFLFIFCTDYW